MTGHEKITSALLFQVRYLKLAHLKEIC